MFSLLSVLVFEKFIFIMDKKSLLSLQHHDSTNCQHVHFLYHHFQNHEMIKKNSSKKIGLKLRKNWQLFCLDAENFTTTYLVEQSMSKQMPSKGHFQETTLHGPNATTENVVATTDIQFGCRVREGQTLVCC